MILDIDTETFSETPIKYGTYRYVADSELMLATWSIDEGPVQYHDFTEDPEPPVDLEMALIEADEVWAHNAMFDRNVLNKHLQVARAVPLERWRCTMVQALAHALPGGLDRLCDILQVPVDQAKHKSGKQLIHLFCKPQPKNHKIRRATRVTHPQKWQEFIEYGKSDIPAMQAARRRMPRWNYPDSIELQHWHRDQRINDRGFGVDLALTEAAIEATARAQERLSVQVSDLTDTDVTAATQRDKLLAYILREHGVDLPDMQGSTLERRLADPDIPDAVKELLRIRLSASTSSTSKYKAVSRGAVDGRLCGTLQFCGAGRTRRAAGRTFQPQNLPSRDLLPHDEIEFGIEVLKAGAAEAML